MTRDTRAIADRSPRQRADARAEERDALHRRLLLLPFCVAVFSLSALLYYHVRFDAVAVESPLQVAYSAIYLTFGFAPSFFFFLLLLIWTSIWFFTGRIERPWSRLLRLLATTVMLGVFLNIGAGTATPHAPYQGDLGVYLASRLVGAFGYYPSLVLVLVVTLGALLLATDFLFSETFERLWARSVRDDDTAADDGVEAAVTDHLKGLADQSARTSPIDSGPARVAPAARAGAMVADVEVDSDDDEVAAEVHEFDETEIEGEPAVEAPVLSRRRRSYFERRHAAAREQDEHEAAEAVAGESGAEAVEPDTRDEAWLPRAPEEQEIENPEFGVELAGPDARSEPAGAAAPGPADEPDLGDLAAWIDVQEAASAGPAEEADADGEPEPGFADAIADERADELDEEAEEAAEPGFEDEAGDEIADEPEFQEQAELDDDVVDAEAAEAQDEPTVAIPRPPESQVARPQGPAGVPSTRQQGLFPSAVDERLVDEAQEVVRATRRVSAAFLRRRLRIGYDEACDVLAALSARGVVELEADASQGRLVED